MAVGSKRVRKRSKRLQSGETLATLVEHLAPRLGSIPARVRDSTRSDVASVNERWALVDVEAADRAEVCPASSVAVAARYARNIENYIGEARVPIGLAGPLRMNGLAARADYYVPLATHEAFARHAERRAENVRATRTLAAEVKRRARPKKAERKGE